jgi:hypothetical protein
MSCIWRKEMKKSDLKEVIEVQKAALDHCGKMYSKRLAETFELRMKIKALEQLIDAMTAPCEWEEEEKKPCAIDLEKVLAAL